MFWGFPGGSEGKVFACNAGNWASIPGSGRAPGVGNGNPLQYSCLENPMDRGAWKAIVHGVTQSRTHLSMHACTRGWNCLKYFMGLGICTHRDQLLTFMGVLSGSTVS